MFEGFSEETSQFFWDLAFHNEKPWFDAHKDTYIRVLKTPFQSLAEDTRDALTALTGDEYDLHVSRIYRDARRLFGRGPYKDHLWFTLKKKGWPGDLSFWFSLSASSWGYGVGAWTRAAETENWRRYIDAEPAAVERLVKRLKRQKELKLGGESYKRPKGDKGELLNEWYNKRELEIGCHHDFGDRLFDKELPQKLAESYQWLLPYGELFAHAYDER